MNEPSDDVSALLLPTRPSNASGTAKRKTRRTRKPEPKRGTLEWWNRWIEKNWSWGLVGQSKGTGEPVTSSNARYDVWRCTACQAPLIFVRQSGRHAGPSIRLAQDPRYGYANCFRVAECWALIKEQPHREGDLTLFRHDSRPQSPQPEQASSLLDLPSSFKDPSRTYGTFPGRNKRGPSNIEGALVVDVPTVEPKGGIVRIRALVSTEPAPSSSNEPSTTSPESSTDEWQPPW